MNIKSRNKSLASPYPRTPGKCLMDAWKPELWGPVFLFFLFTGCQSAAPKGNVGHVHSYPIPTIEADWIRNGDPIEFENALWYPADDIEAFIDSEMAMMGEYKGVPFYIDKVDVRPYNRIYTKFGRNQFRFFEKKKGE